MQGVLFLLLLLFFFSFLGPHCGMWSFPGEVSNQSCSHQPIYVTATVTQDPSHVFDLHRSSRQHPILNPLSEARVGTHVLMDPTQVLNPLSSPQHFFLKLQLENKPSDPQIWASSLLSETEKLRSGSRW